MSHSKPPETLISIQWLIRDAFSTQNSERLLLAALGLRCNPANGYSCYPSYERLAEDTKSNVATVIKAAAALERKGLISRTKRRNATNIFAINVNKLKKQVAERIAAKAQAESAKVQYEVPTFEEESDVPDDGAAHLHLTQACLQEYLNTGILDLSSEAKEFLGELTFSEEAGLFCGRGLNTDPRWLELVVNPVPDDNTCFHCIGKKRVCLTWQAESRDTLTIESDEECTECEGSAQ